MNRTDDFSWNFIFAVRTLLCIACSNVRLSELLLFNEKKCVVEVFPVRTGRDCETRKYYMLHMRRLQHTSPELTFWSNNVTWHLPNMVNSLCSVVSAPAWRSLPNSGWHRWQGLDALGLGAAPACRLLLGAGGGISQGKFHWSLRLLHHKRNVISFTYGHTNLYLFDSLKKLKTKQNNKSKGNCASVPSDGWR